MRVSSRQAMILTLTVAMLLVFPAVTQATNWSWSNSCLKSPPSIQVEVPLVEGVAQLPKGAELLALGYRVKRDGVVYLNFRFESSENFIGVRTSEVESSGLPAGAEPYVGREIHQVISETPAAQAGLLPNDVILALNGEKLGRLERFTYMVKNNPVDQPIELKILRDDRTFTVAIELATRKVEVEDFATYQIPTFSDIGHSGLVLGEITPAVARFLPESSREGALVLHIEVGGPAFDSGLRVGDVITGMGEDNAETAAAMIDLLSTAADSHDKLHIAVRRGGRVVEATIRPVGSTQGKKSFTVPVAVSYHKSEGRTRCELGLGMLVDYERDACFGRDGSAHEDWSFGMCLDLFKIEKTQGRRRFSLLWLIKFNW